VWTDHFLAKISHMDLFDMRASVLRTPAWYSDAAYDERPLPLSPGDYKITPGAGRDGRWVVTSIKGDTVYRGIGPVTIE